MLPERNETYEKISAIMDQRKELWLAVDPVRNRDVTELVCPIVSAELLEGIEKALPQQVYFFLSNGTGVSPVGTKVWRIKKRHDVFTMQVLSIRITPDGDCSASYQHMF